MPTTTAAPALGTLAALAASFARSLRASNASPRTIQNYGEGLRLFDTYLGDQGMPRALGALSREHIEAFIADLLQRVNPRTGAPLKALTARNRYVALLAFFRWAVEEGEIAASPMAHMRPPAVEDVPPIIIPAAKFKELLKLCAGATFEARRNTALLLLLYDAGPRRAEMIGMRVGDVDWDADEIAVVGKGRKGRRLHLGATACKALDRYWRARERHPLADLPALWLGPRGPLTDSGLYQVVHTLGRRVDLDIGPHDFRHTATHELLAAGAQEGDVMRLMGWSRREMLDRYGRTAQGERARRAHAQFSPADRL